MSMEDSNHMEEKKENSFDRAPGANRMSALDELDHVSDQHSSVLNLEDHPSSSSLRQRRGAEQASMDEEQAAGFLGSDGKDGSSKFSSSKGGNSEAGGDDKKEESKKDGEKEDEDAAEEGLPASIFSLIFLAEVKSWAHTYSVIVYLVQIIVVTAALLDSFDTDSSSNPANIPPGVEVAVTIAQGVMIPIAVASQNDFITAIVRLNDRQWETETIGPNNSIHLGRLSLDPRNQIKTPGTMYVRWLISCLTQLFVGFGILCVSFLFMMQSESVFQVLVNIIALFAISSISSNAYNMAAKGFLGYRVWKETTKVSNHKIKRKYRKRSDYQWEVFLYMLCVLGMYAGYGVVVHRQRTGYFLCSQVQVQFDDVSRPDLAFLSGIYVKTDQKIAGRFVYTDEVTGSSFLIGYCRDKNSWGLATYDSGDPCEDNILSQQTFTFDLATTGQVPWRVQSQRDNTFVDTSSFLMQCADCSSSSCQSHRGTCVNNRCVCKDGRYGVNCEFRAPCRSLTLNSNRDGFPPITSLVNEDYVILDSDYKLLKNDTDGYLALSYHRPIYYSQGFQYLLTFAGRRWVIVSPTLLAESGGEGTGFGNLKEAQGQSETEIEGEWKRRIMAEFNNFHMYRHLTNPLLQQFTVSESVDIGSALDQGSPIGLKWLAMRVVRSASRPVMVLDNYEAFDASFICPVCQDDVNDCHNLGTCSNGTCECRSGVLGFPLHDGALCERSVTCTDVQRDHADILPSGCVGDSQCQADTGNCNCLEEFPDAGRFCQFLPCWTDTIQEKFPGGCDNDGVCSNVTGSCVCDPDLFEGKYCQTPVPGCYEVAAQRLYPPNGCDNGGICNDNTGFCECVSDEFFGRYCQRSRPPCTSGVLLDLFPPNGCANGGTCSEESGKCSCASEIFTGHYCEVTNLPCSDSLIKEAYPEDGCASGGVCDDVTGNCVCNPALDNLGRYCQEEFSLNQTSVSTETTTVVAMRLGSDY